MLIQSANPLYEIHDDSNQLSKIYPPSFPFVLVSFDPDRKFKYSIKWTFQLSTVTHYLDLSMVYGSDDQLAARLRAGIGGRMNVEIRYNKEWPPAAINKTDSCTIRSPEESCYQAGKLYNIIYILGLGTEKTLLRRATYIIYRRFKHWTLGPVVSNLL